MNIILQKQSILAVNRNGKYIKENILVKTGADSAMVNDTSSASTVSVPTWVFWVIGGVSVLYLGSLAYKSLAATPTSHAYLNRNYM